MAFDEVAAMVNRFVIAAKIPLLQVVTRTATLMAVKTKRLLVTLLTVVAGFTGKHTVVTDKVGTVIRGNSLSGMAVSTLVQLHTGKVSVGCLLISKTEFVQKGYSNDENSAENKDLFH